MKFTKIDMNVDFKGRSILSDGIVYVGHDPETGLSWNKGHALDAFLARYDSSISSVLLIDDAESNLINVGRYCQEHSYDFTGIHFTKVFDEYQDRQITTSMLEAIEYYQFHQLFDSYNSTILSDEDVLSMMNNDLIFSMNLGSQGVCPVVLNN